MGVRPSRLWPILLLATLAGCAAPRASWQPGKPEKSAEARTPPARPPRDAEPQVHVVAAGETLYRISVRYGVDPQEIASLNGIDDPRTLAVGRELRLPPSARDRDRTASSRQGAGQGANPGTASLSVKPPDERAPILLWPVKGVLYSRFGKRGATRHDGIDIAAPEGTPIAAAADGEVIFAGSQRGYGNLVILRHEDGLVTIYAHNRENLVKEGARIRQGEVLGKVGRTGRASGPHCHFEVRRGTTPLEPLDYLPR